MVVEAKGIKATLRRLVAAIANPNGSSPPDASDEPTGNTEIQSGADGFVPPEERVHQLLAAHEGITWQSHVVADTGWSAPKTSRVLSEMENAGEIARYRIGREKVVCLPGSEPACVRQGTEQPDTTASERPAAKV